uniref:C2H2-type domain-containing protein n=1 Tax=Neogobius melanostomus TaxID=47308 RepID=A0A8C6SLS5_9GOBI
MDSDILNIEDIVMGRSMPDPPPTVSPPKSAEPLKPVAMNGPPASTVTPYQHENLQCFQCFITFCSAKAKERHMKKSHREEYKQVLQQGNTLFTCYVCDRTFMSSEELTQHQPTHSKDDKPFKCVHCKESFKTFSELTVHRRQLCPERQFPCKDCSETFRSAAMLRTHRLAQHPRTDEMEQQEEAAKSPMCKKCGQSFDSETELIAHTEKHPEGQPCNGAASNKKRGRPAKTDDAAAAAEKKGKRKKKDEGEESEELEKVPSTSESVGTAEEKGKSAGPKRGRPPKGASKTDAEDKSSADEEQGTEKKPKGEPPRQIPCTECDLTFPGLVQLRAHKKEKHTQKKAHPCEECEESFARPEQLDAHMSRVHAVGRFACSTCGKSFGRERTLKAHEKTHTEEETQAAKR